jgi:hypothetical protein
LKGISAPKKHLIVAYWIRDYCQNGSRNLRMSRIVRFETQEERSFSKEGRVAFFEMLQVIRSEAREGFLGILRIMIPVPIFCGKGWPAKPTGHLSRRSR